MFASEISKLNKRIESLQNGIAENETIIENKRRIFEIQKSPKLKPIEFEISELEEKLAQKKNELNQKEKELNKKQIKIEKPYQKKIENMKNEIENIELREIKELCIEHKIPMYTIKHTLWDWPNSSEPSFSKSFPHERIYFRKW